MSRGRPAVLVVDADELLADLLMEVFDDAGFAVLTASSVRGALETAALNEIDLVLTDLDLKSSSGFELLMELAVCAPGTPAILMTAFLDDETEKKAHRLGARAALGKPFRNDDLLALVRRVLEIPGTGRIQAASR